MMLAATVYVVTNTLNGHQYVGVTRYTSEHRWAQHVGRAKRLPSYIHRAICKYGAEAFTVEAAASCLSLRTAGRVEQNVIHRLKPVYNQTNGGEVTIGRKVTDEVKARLRVRMLWRKFTLEENAANSARRKEQFRTNPVIKQAAIDALAKGRMRMDREKQKAAAGKAARERVWTDESRAKLSASCMGRVSRKDVVDRIRLSRCKPVTCNELDMTFGCIEEASIRLGFSVYELYKVCGGKRKNINGLTFQYETDPEKCADAKREHVS